MDFSASLASSHKECVQLQLSGALAEAVFNSWVSELQGAADIAVKLALLLALTI